MSPETRGRHPQGGALVCFAVKEEARLFKPGSGGDTPVAILITGMGRRNADRALRRALEIRKPSLVLSCGFAGGLDPELISGAVVFDAPPDSRLERDLLSAGARKVRFHSAERVAATAAEKRSLREATGADAVEMESRAIGAVCREHAIPFAIVRVILDTAEEDLPLDFNLLMTPEQRLDYGRLARALLKSPGKAAGLVRLQKQSKAAAQALGEVLGRILPPRPQP